MEGFMLRRKSARWLGRLGQGAERPSRNAQLHTADALRLEIDSERAARGPFGMADFVAGLGSPSGELAHAAHTIAVEQLQK